MILKWFLSQKESFSSSSHKSLFPVSLLQKTAEKQQTNKNNFNFIFFVASVPRNRTDPSVILTPTTKKRRRCVKQLPLWRNVGHQPFGGATTLSITTFYLTTLRKATLNIMTLRITRLNLLVTAILLFWTKNCKFNKEK